MKTWTGPERPDPNDRVQYAAMETEEELDFEYTGLYQIIWALRGHYGPGTDADFLPDALPALDRVLGLEMGVLRKAIWTKTPAGPILDRADLEDSWFDAPDEETGEYVVIDTVRERPP